MKKMIVESYNSRVKSASVISFRLPTAARRTRTYRVDEEPMFIDSFLIEEKRSADETLIEIVGYKSRKPPEHVEAGIGLEHEEGDRLLKEQADYDGAPLDVGPVLRRRPKAKLKHDETEDGDCAVTVRRTLIRPTPRINKVNKTFCLSKK